MAPSDFYETFSENLKIINNSEVLEDRSKHKINDAVEPLVDSSKFFD